MFTIGCNDGVGCAQLGDDADRHRFFAIVEVQKSADLLLTI